MPKVTQITVTRDGKLKEVRVFKEGATLDADVLVIETETTGAASRVSDRKLRLADLPPMARTRAESLFNDLEQFIVNRDYS